MLEVVFHPPSNSLLCWPTTGNTVARKQIWKPWNLSQPKYSRGSMIFFQPEIRNRNKKPLTQTLIWFDYSKNSIILHAKKIQASNQAPDGSYTIQAKNTLWSNIIKNKHGKQSFVSSFFSSREKGGAAELQSREMYNKEEPQAAIAASSKTQYKEMKSSFVIEALHDPSSTLWSSSVKPLQQTHDPQEEESLGSVVRKLHLSFSQLLLLLHKSLFPLPNYSHLCGLFKTRWGVLPS